MNELGISGHAAADATCSHAGTDQLDPCLELFGHGWTPPATMSADETYVGRHRASAG